ncbi:MAG: hypothetical protein EP341_00385 [Sphingomonadales bacterium]|nr:MAG: hypothetical protein EP341_00385 [Sphingomonadales bacterium]
MTNSRTLTERAAPSSRGATVSAGGAASSCGSPKAMPARRYGGCKGTLPKINESAEPRFLNLRDGGNLPQKPFPLWPFVLIISCLIVFLFLSIEKAMAQSVYDQINAGQYSCGAC